MNASPRFTGSWRSLSLALGLGGFVAVSTTNALAAADEATAAATSASAAERAERESRMVFKWIMVQRENSKRWTVGASAPAAAVAVPQAASSAASQVAVAARKAPSPAASAASTLSMGSIARAVSTAVSSTIPATREAAKPATPVPRSSGIGPQSAEPVVAGVLPARKGSPAGRPGVHEVVAAETGRAASLQLDQSVPGPILAAEAKAPLEEVPEPDLPLELVQQVDPKFPPGLLARLQKGQVKVQFDVEPDGSLTHVEVLESSHARLNGPVLHALAQWKFKPLHHAQSGGTVLAFDVEGL